MVIRQINRYQTSLTLINEKGPLFLILLLFGTSLAFALLSFHLFGDTGQVSLTCHGGTCLYTRVSIAVSVFANSASFLSPTAKRFVSSSLEDVLVLERVERDKNTRKVLTSWDVELVLIAEAAGEVGKWKRREQRFRRFTSRQKAERVANTIKAALWRTHLVRPQNKQGDTGASNICNGSGDDNGLVLNLLDVSIQSEMILLVVFLVVLLLSTSQSISEMACREQRENIVVNHDSGTMSIERLTFLMSSMSLLDKKMHRSNNSLRLNNRWSNVVFRAPTSFVRSIEAYRFSWGGRYGVRLLMQDRPDINLVCTFTFDRGLHKDQLQAVRSIVQEAQDGAERLRRLAEESRGRGIADTAQARENNDGASTSAVDIAATAPSIHLESNGGVGSRVPGNKCVICIKEIARAAFVPCGHVCCCVVCSQNSALTKCPICRQDITHSMELFFS